MIWAGLFLALALLAFVMAERRRRPMDAAARQNAPGQFAELPSGRTHYRWDGSVRGPVAVCVHGLTTGNYILDGVAANLSRMGYRVLRYDLYGRGFSDRPAGRQDRAFFLRQLRELLDHLELQGDLTFVGYSMGGAISTAFTAEEPHRVDRLMIMASAGLGQKTPRLAAVTRDVPLLGDWIMQVVGGWELRRMSHVVGREQGLPDNLIEAQIEETRFRGFLRAVLSSMRHMLAEDLGSSHARIARTDIPVLALWAEEDEVIPLSALGRLAEINRNAMQVSVSGATHGLPVTHTDEIHTAMQTFLREV